MTLSRFLTMGASRPFPGQRGTIGPGLGVESCDLLRMEHAIRAVVLHATPMGDSCVSACEGTATTVLVCRTISPFRPSRLNNWVYIHTYALVQLRRALLAFALLRLSKFR